MDVHVIIWIRGGKYKVKAKEKGRVGRGGDRKGRYRENYEIINLLIKVLCHSENIRVKLPKGIDNGIFNKKCLKLVKTSLIWTPV